MKSFVFILVGLLLTTVNLRADDAPLDPPYENLVHPSRGRDVQPFDASARASKRKNDVLSLIAMQTPVKSQMARGTCSIFSATALLESLIKIKTQGEENFDLSEEFLEYIKARVTFGDGSTSTRNFSLMIEHGMPFEDDLPYIGETWESVVPNTLSQKRCEALESYYQKACLIGHRDPSLFELPDEELATVDPELASAKAKAVELRDTFLKGMNRWGFSVYNTVQIKRLLDLGIPVTLDVDFYYGAWNHRKSVELDIPRNMDHWEKGIVGYPLEGSKDAINSLKERAGHSIVIVGYDDDYKLTLKHTMPNGTVVERTYRGVYYFKNSWGTTNFGTKTTIEGQVFPGYGIITQLYAEKFGGFYQLPMSLNN